MNTTWYDTMTTLGWLAGITERVRLLSHVAVPVYRHPLVSAKAVATLDSRSHEAVTCALSRSGSKIASRSWTPCSALGSATVPMST